ncbi:hypothetical protein JCGZ_15110 [Jatropha curcas]|uniref:IBH1-like N-terminal domain-containing protein n=1 Tax=Jatropha curcas TaxID=180498 RepID=A0A067LKN8_JATCU|nr:transcription factor IBH1-like [Jatropha curcas]KDP45245.1 hypothetical protein JCGZ_15110 [Jatropha curcas]
MNPRQQLSLNPNSIKSRFTRVFLKSLCKINKQRSFVPYCPKEIYQRSNRVKIAADKSLAFAVGSRKAWSRALLFKIRNRRRQWRHRTNLLRRIKERKDKSCLSSDVNDAGFDLVRKLRKLVPGGEAMELSKLLEEAAHYVKCLKTQVQVMRSIADICSTTVS